MLARLTSTHGALPVPNSTTEQQLAATRLRGFGALVHGSARRRGPQRPSRVSGTDTVTRRNSSFDDFVGEREQAWQDVESDRLGGLEIDDEFELGRQLYRQVARLFAL